MTERTYHRGAVVSKPLTFHGAAVLWDFFDSLARPSTAWQVQHRANSARNSMCHDALEQFGKSSYRNRQGKKGPVARFGRKS